jgi:hypothetical protein
MRLTILIAFLLIGLNISAYAQGNGIITVNIVTPISISKTFDSYSGTLALASTSTTNKTIRKYNSLRTMAPRKSLTIDVPAANFTLSGVPSFSYSISLPSVPLTIVNGTSSITIEDFTLQTNSSIRDESGFSVDKNITVMAKVKLNAAPAAGHYVAPAPINIIVNYE